MIPLLSLLFLTAWGNEPRPVPVNLDSLPASAKMHVILRMDSVANCDSDSRVKMIVQDSIASKSKGDAAGFPAWKADGHPIQQLTYLSRSGDSLFFMAGVQEDSVTNFFTSVCLDKKDILRVSLEDQGGGHEDDGDKEHKPHAGGMGGHRRGMGMGGMGGMR